MRSRSWTAKKECNFVGHSRRLLLEEQIFLRFLRLIYKTSARPMFWIIPPTDVLMLLLLYCACVHVCEGVHLQVAKYILISYCGDQHKLYLVPCLGLLGHLAQAGTIQKMNRALGWVARHGRRYNRVQIMQRQIAGCYRMVEHATTMIQKTWY